MIVHLGAGLMKISVFGVLVGGVVDVASSVVAGLPLALYSTFRLDPSQRIGPRASEAVSAAIHANVPLYVAQLIIGFLCSILGGYVAALIAKRHERLNGTLSCYLCVCMGVVAMFLGLEKDPYWLQFLLLISSPALAFVGGDLRLRQRLAKSAA
jgi:hypothetical protein